MNNNNKSITPKAANKATPLDTSAQLVKNESIDYNIVKDMKRACANISIFQLVKITGKHELVIQAVSLQSLIRIDPASSTTQVVSSKTLSTLEYV